MENGRRMNEELEKINNTITGISQLKSEIRNMKSHEYKCEHWEDYENNYNTKKNKLNNYYNLLCKQCNEYIKYPKEKLLFIDLTKKVKIINNSIFGTEVNIPYVDKQEYHCLIKLFNSHNNIIKLWGNENYIISYMKRR